MEMLILSVIAIVSNSMTIRLAGLKQVMVAGMEQLRAVGGAMCIPYMQVYRAQVILPRLVHLSGTLALLTPPSHSWPWRLTFTWASQQGAVAPAEGHALAHPQDQDEGGQDHRGQGRLRLQ